MLHDQLAAAVGSRYSLERELPAGGMARVFLARDPILDRAVVVKVLPPERATATAIARFQREAKLLARLNHPHIIPILDSSGESVPLWFVMPWIAGESLAAQLASGPLPHEAVRTIGIELLDALAHAHQLGVVHRDIKPANIFLNAGHALLADFGVAQLHDSVDGPLTDEGNAIGTVAYMSPEHRGGAPADPRSDVWALGATLYEALTGTRWIDRGAEPGLDAVPTALRAALARALATDPAERWPSARSFRKALLPTRRSSLSTVMTAVGLLATGLVALLWWQSRVGATGSAAPVGDSVDVHVAAVDTLDAFTSELARNAGYALEWLPRLRTAVERDVPARHRILLRRAAVGEPLVVIEGRSAGGELEFVERLSGTDLDPGGGRRVAGHVVAALFPAVAGDFALLVNSSDDIPALRAWYRGAAAFQDGRWKEAEHEYATALQHDSGFVAARWAVLLTRIWLREPYEEELHALSRISDRLPEAIRQLVEAQLEPDLHIRIRQFDVLATAWPDFAPARMLLANELLHRGPLIGRPMSDGLDAFVAAAAAVPELDNHTTWEHVLWGAIRVGDRSLAERAKHRLGQLEGRDDREKFLGLAFDVRFSKWSAGPRMALLSLAATGDVLPLLGRYLRLGLHADIPREVSHLSGLVAERTADADARAGALGNRATALLMMGKLAAALATLDSAAAAATDPVPWRLQAAEWRIALPAFGFAIDTTEVRSAHDDLLAFADSAAWWPRAVWHLALFEWRSGRATAGDEWLDSLARGATANPLAAHLLPLADAQRLARVSGAAAALDRSTVIAKDAGDGINLARGPLVRALTYHARGSWMLQRGDSAGADREWRWYENNDLQGWPVGPPQEGELDAALSVVMRNLRAELLCAGGDTTQGRSLRERAAVLWTAGVDAEPAAIRQRARDACL